MTWTKEPPIEGKQQPCLHAGIAENLFPPDGIIAVGFGAACLTCSGACIWEEGRYEDKPELTGAEAEALALEDPDKDWRIFLMGPLSEREYQRHGPGQWVLIKQGEGFA